MNSLEQKISTFNEPSQLKAFMFEHMNVYGYAEELFASAHALFSNKKSILHYIKVQATVKNYELYKQTIEGFYGQE